MKWTEIILAIIIVILSFLLGYFVNPRKDVVVYSKDTVYQFLSDTVKLLESKKEIIKINTINEIQKIKYIVNMDSAIYDHAVKLVTRYEQDSSKGVDIRKLSVIPIGTNRDSINEMYGNSSEVPLFRRLPDSSKYFVK